jgi:hypothetical protein
MLAPLRAIAGIDLPCNMSKTVSLTSIAVFMFSFALCNRDSRYECIERTQKEVPNFHAAGTHPAVDYVLLHKGHKIYASCDTADISNLDPNATCGFRPLRKYECALQTDSILGNRAFVALEQLALRACEGRSPQPALYLPEFVHDGKSNLQVSPRATGDTAHLGSVNS